MKEVQNPFTERVLVIAEKPSVARTIAQVLVCEDKKDEINKAGQKGEPGQKKTRNVPEL